MSKLPTFEHFEAWAARLENAAERDEITAKALRGMKSEGGKAHHASIAKEAAVFRSIAAFLTWCGERATRLRDLEEPAPSRKSQYGGGAS